MVLTQAQKVSVIKHVLENVMGLAEDSNLLLALKQEALVTIQDILGMSQDFIESLTYIPDGDVSGKEYPLTASQRGLISAFQSFVLFCSGNNNPITDEGWMDITEEEFNNYWLVLI